MTGWGRRISSPEDFPNVAVYANGPVINVVFKNREGTAGTSHAAFGCFVMAVAAVGGVFPIVVAVGIAERYGGLENVWLWGGLAWLALMGLVMWATIAPQTQERRIELDSAKNQFRVYKAGRVTVTQPLDKVYTFTVGKHPQAESEALRNPGAVGQFQKQHCLYGRFGPGGAHDVNLVCRWEWPNRNSLYEVRQALEWIFEGAPGALLEEEAPKKIAGGLRPPLE